MAISIKAARAESRCNTMVDLLDAGTGNGKILLYSGMIPSNADEAITTQTLVVSITLQKPAFGAASTTAGVASAVMQGTPSGDAAAVTGYPHELTFFRAVDSDDNVLWQGIVTGAGGGGDATMSTTTATADGQTFTVSSWQWDEPTVAS